MNALNQLQILANVRIPRRILTDRINPVEHYSNVQFFVKFRLSKTTALYVFGLVVGQLQRPNRRGSPVPPLLEFLAAIRFYATGAFQDAVGEPFLVSQSGMSRIVRRVSAALASLNKRFIKFPVGNDCTKQKQRFMAVGGIPGVIGAIDCTHVAVRSPGGNSAELYRNRHGNFSINVQAVADADLRFINIVARWPGSVHDSRIFANSRLCAEFENGDHAGILLGDSGYAIKPYLMTPFLTPSTRAERRYNYGHCRARNTVERMFGVFKKRFACLSIDSSLRLRIDRVLETIIACAVLHNIARDDNADMFDDAGVHANAAVDVNNNNAAQPQLVNRLGVAVRRRIVEQNF